MPTLEQQRIRNDALENLDVDGLGYIGDHWFHLTQKMDAILDEYESTEVANENHEPAAPLPTAEEFSKDQKKKDILSAIEKADEELFSYKQNIKRQQLIARRGKLLYNYITYEKKEAAPTVFAAVKDGTYAVFKPVVNVLDDIVSALRNGVKNLSLSANTIPFLVGASSGVVAVLEGKSSFSRAIKSIKKYVDFSPLKRKNKQLKTRIFTSLGALYLSSIGIWLGSSYIAYTAGLPVLAGSFLSPFIPVILPAVLTGICLLNLGRHAYVLYQAKKLEASTKQQYELDKGLLSDCKKKHAEVKQNVKECIAEFHRINASDEIEKNTKLKQCKRKLLDYISDNRAADEEIAKLETQLVKSSKNYEKWRENRLNAERKTVLAGVDLAVQAAFFVGSILGTAAIIGASVASLGALPLAITVCAVVISISIKLFEVVDKKYNHKFSRGMRDWFVDKYARVKNFFSPSPAPELVAPAPVLGSTNSKIMQHLNGATTVPNGVEHTHGSSSSWVNGDIPNGNHVSSSSSSHGGSQNFFAKVTTPVPIPKPRSEPDVIHEGFTITP